MNRKLAERALWELIETINATGGVKEVDGCMFPVPVADEDWPDLGEAYKLACAALDVEPQFAVEENS